MGVRRTTVEAIRETLASHTGDHAVGRELHAVPPHLVHEVEFDGRRAVCKVGTGPPADPVTEARVTESVRPLPEGFETRREAHVLVQTVSYLGALFVQERHGDPAERADW